MTRILSIIVTPRFEDAERTFNSLRDQSIHTTVYCVKGKPDRNKQSGQIIGETINDYLRYIDLFRFDWIFKSDDDVLYPKDFLEAHVNADYDAVGKDISMLVKVKPFLKVMGGKWNETDMCGSYLFWMFQANHFRVFNDWIIPPIAYEKPHFSVKRAWIDGGIYHRLGFPFLAFTETMLKSSASNPISLFFILGYVHSWISRSARDENATLTKFIKSKHKKLYKTRG